MKIITLQRTSDNGKTTLGRLVIDDLIFISLEDTFRKEKIKHETRIPAGKYEIKLRKFGGHHEKYSKRFPFHAGMLWLQDVPGFSDILIHIGNTAHDSSGCLLIGESAVSEDQIINSTIAYTKFYKYVMRYFYANEQVFINIIDNK